MRTIAFHQSAFDQYNEWALRDKKVFEHLKRLITEAGRTPFGGIVKPYRSNANSQVIGHAGSQTSTDSSIRLPTTNSSSPRASIITSRLAIMIKEHDRVVLNTPLSGEGLEA